MRIILQEASGGLGIEENIVTLCPICHHEYDNGKERQQYKQKIKQYLQEYYGEDWNEEKLIYKKYNWGKD